MESTPPHKKSKKPGLNRVKVSEIKGKVNHQARGIISGRKKSEIFCCIFDRLPAIGKSVIYATIFFSLHLAQLEFVGNPGFCH